MTKPDVTYEGDRRAAGGDRRTVSRALAAFAVAVIIGHHLGTILKPLGTVGPTEWADWVDLLVPLTVLGTAAAALVAAVAARREWLIFGIGAVLYAQGHGIHLGANSISNAGTTGRAKEAAHLWDEVMGHYIWYGGLALVVLALFFELARAGVPERAGALGYVLAVLFGITWTTNAIEGGTVPLSGAVAVGLLVLARKQAQAAVARLVLAAYGLSLVLILGWGVWHRGFPQFSELGLI